MTAAALNAALDLFPSSVIAKEAGCSKQAVDASRRRGEVSTLPGSAGPRIAEAVETLTERRITAKEILTRDPVRLPQPAKKPPHGDREVANATSRATWREKRGGAPPKYPVKKKDSPDAVEPYVPPLPGDETEGELQHIVGRRRDADARKKVADAEYMEEKVLEMRAAKAVRLGELLPAADVRSRIEAAAVVFRRACDDAPRQMDQAACGGCRDAVQEALGEYLEKVRGEVMGALRGKR